MSGVPADEDAKNDEEEPYKKKGAKTKEEERKDNMEGKEGKPAMDCGVHTKHVLYLCVMQYFYST